jgi:hypothetical protein
MPGHTLAGDQGLDVSVLSRLTFYTGGDRVGARRGQAQAETTGRTIPPAALDLPGCTAAAPCPSGRAPIVHAGASRCTAAGAGRCRSAGDVAVAPWACTWCPPGHAGPLSPIKAVLNGVSLWQYRSESFRGNTERGEIARRGVIRYLEDQGNAFGMVLDVGFIGLMTHCRSG